jgi:hypothetical protein
MGMEIRSLLISILVFSAVTIGLSNFYTELHQNYGVASPESTAFLNATSEITETTQEMQEKFSNSSITNIPTLGIAYTFVTASYDAVKLAFSTVNVLSTILSEIVSLPLGFNIPSWFVGIVIGIVIIIVVLSAISAFTKSEV